MDVFISYARGDAAVVEQLRRDIVRSQHLAWYDQDLEGGKVWWDEILDRIRSCTLFVLVLSPDSVHSRACRAELAYAVALQRPVLPVRVRDVDLQLAPDPIPALHVIEYGERTPENAIELLLAINRTPTSVPRPDRLPPPPPPPLLSLGPVREMVGADRLTYGEQQEVVIELRERLANVDERGAAVVLLREFRRRNDVVESVGAEIDRLLSSSSVHGLGPARSGSTGEALDLFRSLVTQIRRRHCTPVLGWGLTDSLIGPRHLIARKWAETFEYPMAAHEREDLPQVAEFVAVMTDVTTLRESLEQFCREELSRRHPDLRAAAASTALNDLFRECWAHHHPTVQADPHVVLADLPCPIYVTAHPTNLLADALRAKGRAPVVEICRWRSEVYEWPESVFVREPDYVPDPERPLVFHVFGNLDFLDSLVITEDDYLEFLSTVAESPTLVPPAVRDALTDSALLLMGFGLEEWDVRFLLRSLISQPGAKRLQKYTHVAVQIDISDHVLSPDRARRYLERYFGKFRQPSIDIFWGTSDEFAVGLAEAWAGAQ
jgi:hypothetical protein